MVYDESLNGSSIYQGEMTAANDGRRRAWQPRHFLFHETTSTSLSLTDEWNLTPEDDLELVGVPPGEERFNRFFFFFFGFCVDSSPSKSPTVKKEGGGGRKS